MSVGYSPKLPLKEAESGAVFGLNESLREAIQQNVKMLVLTSPGERIMDPNFGVGIRNYLFEQNTPQTHTSIKTKIIRQTQEYLPFLEIDIFFFESSSKKIAGKAFLFTQSKRL